MIWLTCRQYLARFLRMQPHFMIGGVPMFGLSIGKLMADHHRKYTPSREGNSTCLDRTDTMSLTHIQLGRAQTEQIPAHTYRVPPGIGTHDHDSLLPEYGQVIPDTPALTAKNCQRRQTRKLSI